MWARAIDEWAGRLRLEGCAATTIRTRRQHLGQLARESDRGPWDHTTASLLDWLDGHGWSAESRHAARSSLRSFYRVAVADGHLGVSPAASLPRVRRSTPRPRPAPDVVYLAALASAESRERLMLRLGGEVGLRRGEIARVGARDIIDDMVGWSLAVRGKGGGGGVTRIVPLPDTLALDLISHAPEGWMFPGHNDGHLAPQRVGDLMSDALPGRWTAHTLRHRAATRWFGVDHDLLTVRDLLGHASVATTQAYVQTDDNDARRTVAAVSSGGPRSSADRALDF